MADTPSTYLFDVKWSRFRPLVFACAAQVESSKQMGWTALDDPIRRSLHHLPPTQKDGGVYVFDLHDDLAKPVAILRDKDAVCPVQCLSFNPKYVRLIGVIQFGFVAECTKSDLGGGGANGLNNRV